MKLSSLLKFFRKEEDAEVFFMDIAVEVEAYKRALSIRGGSAPVYIDADVEELKLSAKDTLVLCDLYMDGTIDKYTLNYIAEGLLLSENVKPDAQSGSILEGLTETDFLQNASNEYVRELMASSPNTRAWIEAAAILSKDPQQKVVCPSCSNGFLSVRDELWPNGEKVDRNLTCGTCNSWNVVTMNVNKVN